MMTQLTLTILLQAASFSAAAKDYATAYRETSETGRPLVVLIGADWCPGCRQMKYTSIPELEKKGGLNRVSFAYVNTDQQGDLAGKLMQGGSIPQLVMYRKTDSGWKLQRLVGAQSPTAIQQFLSTGSMPIANVSSREVSNHE